MATGPSKKSRAEGRKIRRQLFSKQGLISFSETWNEPLLWSHYADCHRGVALGFDLMPKVAFKVNYVDKRLIVPNGREDAYVFWERPKFFDLIERTKYCGWSYEREVRIFANNEGSIYENGLYFRPFGDFGELKEVIIGADYEGGKNSSLEKALHDEGVEVITGRLAFEDFSVKKQNRNSLKKLL
ncbi:MAG: DUF2971 domain-containing protein [Salaquimonas sp.]|nr:DUF2971 domain-containing protein [Salaquimonas sp.]